MKIRHFLMVAFAAMTMFGLSSCEDDPVEPNNSNNTNQYI